MSSSKFLKTLTIVAGIVLAFVAGEAVGKAKGGDLLAHVDWNLWVAVAVAGVALVGLFMQLRQARFVATLDSLWHLEAQYNDLEGKRQDVAAALLSDRHSTSTDDLLNFFDVIGYLVERGAIDVETIWIMFSHPAVGYWFGAHKYMEEQWASYPLYWDHYRKLIARLLPIEAKKRKVTEAEVTKSAREAAKAFLEDECRNAQPSEKQTERPGSSEG